jgi:hypothetical protein
MTEARGIDDQDNESVEAYQMDSTILKAQICSSSGYASVQLSKGESISTSSQFNQMRTKSSRKVSRRWSNMYPMTKRKILRWRDALEVL